MPNLATRSSAARWVTLSSAAINPAETTGSDRVRSISAGRFEFFLSARRRRSIWLFASANRSSSLSPIVAASASASKTASRRAPGDRRLKQGQHAFPSHLVDDREPIGESCRLVPVHNVANDNLDHRACRLHHSGFVTQTPRWWTSPVPSVTTPGEQLRWMNANPMGDRRDARAGRQRLRDNLCLELFRPTPAKLSRCALEALRDRFNHVEASSSRTRRRHRRSYRLTNRPTISDR